MIQPAPSGKKLWKYEFLTCLYPNATGPTGFL